jgi:hypothetical protein
MFKVIGMINLSVLKHFGRGYKNGVYDEVRDLSNKSIDVVHSLQNAVQNSV